MGLLDGGGAALFAEVLSPLYLPATVYAMASTYNARGDLQRTPTERGCRAQVDVATERMRQQPDFAATDRAIFILSTTLEGELNSDAEVAVHAGPYAGTRWKVADPIDRDPCGAYWRCRGVLGKVVPA